jgi:hypothetical protein
MLLCSSESIRSIQFDANTLLRVANYKVVERRSNFRGYYTANFEYLHNFSAKERTRRIHLLESRRLFREVNFYAQDL